MVDLFKMIIFIFPAYIANAAPVLLGGGRALDLGKNFFDNERIFGDSKTIRGFIAGVATGTVAGAILATYFPLSFFADKQSQFMASFMLSLGALTGDAAGSFIKRRMKVKNGHPFILDSVLFLFFALLFAYPFTVITEFDTLFVILLFIFTMVLHPLTNLIANKLGLKNVPW